MWPYMGSMGWWMVLWWLAGIVVLIVLVTAIARASGGRASPVDDSPEQILKRRYARGEIDREEYQRRLEDLRR